MKLFVVAAVLGVAAAGRLDNTYLPPRGSSGGGYAGASAPSVAFGAKSTGGFGQASGGFGQASGGFGHASGGFNQGAGIQAHHGGNAPAQTYNTRAQASYDANAQILRLNSDVTAEGFSYDFETSNGIRADAHGVATNGVQSQGSFAYKGDDGQDYSITYTADENGYRPQGAHLPTPPPIPEEILRSLEQNARDEAAGISDDGQYRGEGAGHSGGYGNANAGFGHASGQGSGQAAGQFGGNSVFQGKATLGAGASRYLPPNAGPARNSGSFSPNSGYQY